MKAVDRRVPAHAPWRMLQRSHVGGRLRSAWHDPGLRCAAAVTVAARVLLELIGLAATAMSPPHAYAEQRFFAAPITDVLLAPFQREDAVWYQHIAADGYDVPQASAFMPLFPLGIRLLGAVLSSQALAAMLIPTLSTFAALWLMHRLVSADVSHAVARRAVLLIAVAPAAYFLWAPFTEGMFLLESVAVFWLARQGRHVAAGVVVGLAVLTRLQGAVLLVPLAMYVVMDWRRRAEPPRALVSSLARAVLPPVAAAAALTVALTASGWRLGVFGAQALWGAHAAPPWTVLTASVAAIAGGHHPEELLNLLSVIGAAATVPWMWRKLPAPYALFTAASLIVIVCHLGGNSPLMSASRFVAVIFPVFVALAAVLRRPRQFRAVAVVFAVSCALLFVAMVEYVFVA